jgi:hypothetical protein
MIFRAEPISSVDCLVEALLPGAGVSQSLQMLNISIIHQVGIWVMLPCYYYERISPFTSQWCVE